MCHPDIYFTSCSPVSCNECGVGVEAGAPAKDAVSDRAQTPVCAQGRACEYE